MTVLIGVYKGGLLMDNTKGEVKPINKCESNTLSMSINWDILLSAYLSKSVIPVETLLME